MHPKLPDERNTMRRIRLIAVGRWANPTGFDLDQKSFSNSRQPVTRLSLLYSRTSSLVKLQAFTRLTSHRRVDLSGPLKFLNLRLIASWVSRLIHISHLVVANAFRRTFFKQLVSSPLTVPRFKKSTFNRRIHSRPSSPAKPCAPSGTTMCMLFGSWPATASPFAGGVAGSHSPVRIKTGAEAFVGRK